jgi:hypothetical protein
MLYSHFSFIFQEVSPPKYFMYSFSPPFLTKLGVHIGLWDNEMCGEFLMINTLTCFILKKYEKWMMVCILAHNETKGSVAVKPLMFVLCLLHKHKGRYIHALHIMTGLCLCITTARDEMTRICKFAFTQATSRFLFINMLTIKLFVTLVMCLTGPSC